MALITLTLTLDVPRAEQFSDAELRQIIFDDVVNFAVVQHLTQGMKWIVKVGEAEKDPNPDPAKYGDVTRYVTNARALIGHHELWSDIMRAAKFEIAREP